MSPPSATTEGGRHIAAIRALEAGGTAATVARWGLSGCLVLAATAAGAWLALTLPPMQGAEGALQEAMLIELEPITAEIEAPPPAPEPAEEASQEPPVEAEPPAEPEPVEDAAEEIPEAVSEPPPRETETAETPPEPVIEPPPEPVEPPVEPPPPETPEPEEPEPEKPDEIVQETPAPEIATLRNVPIPLARPKPPRPVVEKPRAEKPRTERVAEARPRKPKVERKTREAERPVRRAERRTSTAEPSKAASAGRTASAPRVSPASWQRRAVSHFRKFRRRVETRTDGTARVAITIDRSGRVISARVSGSSGNPVFDREALALVRRASPIPAPPEGVGGKTLALTVPINM